MYIIVLTSSRDSFTFYVTYVFWILYCGNNICTAGMGMDKNIMPDVCICLFGKKFQFYVASPSALGVISIASGALINLSVGRVVLLWKVME